MYVPLSKAIEITGNDSSWLKRKCASGKYKSAKKNWHLLVYRR